MKRVRGRSAAAMAFVTVASSKTRRAATQATVATQCPRRSCTLFGQAGQGNVRPRGWTGRRRLAQ